MIILITGCKGYIANNLVNYLSKFNNIKLLTVDRSTREENLFEYLSEADFIFHLAGVNRSNYENDFYQNNVDLTSKIVRFLEKEKIDTSIYFSSSIKAGDGSIYGYTKFLAENILLELKKNGNRVIIDRLTNIYGPGMRPNYNSVVATFCYKIANSLPVELYDRNKEIELLYIDDLINSISCLLFNEEIKTKSINKIKVEDLFNLIKSINNNKINSGLINNSNFYKNLLCTFNSYLISESNKK